MGDNCSCLFQKYSTYSLSHNEYLLTFKSLCDSSTDLICIIDTSPDYLLLYASKSFNHKLGWSNQDIYMKSLTNFIYENHHTLEKTLLNVIDEDVEQSIRLRILKNDKSNVLVICNIQKIDNILSCTMRIVNENN